MTPERTIAEIDELLRTAPTYEALIADMAGAAPWLGRVQAVVKAADKLAAARLRTDVSMLSIDFLASSSFQSVLNQLHELRYTAQMAAPGSTSVALPAAAPFDYFDEVRKILETAQQHVFFVDPWLDPAFVPRYLPQLKDGIHVRILARVYISKLVPAVELYAAQTRRQVELRSAEGFHDRFIMIDGTTVFQSSSSIKDGAKNAPTMLVQVIDLLPAVIATYEQIWSAANIEFPPP